ncbi:MAG: chorismate mutase [archaeon]
MDIEELRKEIDSIDNKIISLLSKRKHLIKKIAETKKELHKPIFDREREAQLLKRIKALSKEEGLDKDYIQSIYEIILKDSREKQKNI